MGCLDDMLCKNLYSLSRQIIKINEQHLRHLEITYPQCLVLLMLKKQGNCYVDEISKELALDTGTVTPMIKKMIKKGLVEKIRNAHDERKVLVVLKPLGAEVAERATDALQSTVKMLDTNNHEIDLVIKLLNKIFKK